MTRLRQGALQAEEALSCEALLQTAMDMYDLEHFEILHEELLETRVRSLASQTPCHAPAEAALSWVLAGSL